VDQTERKIPAAGWWWASFDWARSPFYYVIVIYVFSTYFAQTVVGDPARGQTLFSTIVTIAGAVMAVIAPLVGGYMDRGGAKKPVLALAILVLALSSAGLSLVYPGRPSAIPLAMTLLVIAGCCYSISELFHNALLPAAGNARQVPAISGLGLSAGSAGAVLLLTATLYLTRNPPAGMTEADVARLSGLACGIWMLLFMAPFFRFMPDLPGAAGRWRGVSPWPESLNILRTVKALFGDFPNVMRFLVARMIFMDGLTALFAITAVYTAGALGWDRSETAAMGILATIAAVLGGFLGSWLDRRFGPRNAIIGELFTITAIFLFQLSVTRDALLFGLVPIAGGTDNGSMFGGATDLIYLASMVPTAALIVAAYSSSRSLLVALSPADRLGQFFGIYAMTSTVTVWVGPGLVALTTWLSDSQRIGFGSLMLLFLMGSVLMLRVRRPSLTT
jgi:UMF1 family MFS transporter